MAGQRETYKEWGDESALQSEVWWRQMQSGMQSKDRITPPSEHKDSLVVGCFASLILSINPLYLTLGFYY